MTTHVFHVFEDGDIHVSLEVHALSSTDSFQDWARKILIQHPRAEYVIVKCDNVIVATEHREPPKALST